MMRKKLKTINKKLYIVLMLVVIVGCCFLFQSDMSNRPSDKFKYQTKAYDPMQNEIAGYNLSKNSYIPLSSLYTSNNGIVANSTTVPADQTISITTAEELYAFSVLASQDDRFLGYKYILLSNINYSGQNAFVPIAWQLEKTFTGTFDGNGYEITNLLLPSNISNDQYSDLRYYSMFSRNDGIIRNLGLINTNIVFNNPNVGDVGVSPLVGLNTNLVENVYVRDLRDAIEDEAGITAAGGYQISGLLFDNKGTLRNAYTAYSIISNYTITDYIDFREIVTNSTGTVENAFFYNETITNYEVLEGNKELITYHTGLVGKEYTWDKYATYCDSLSDLNTKVKASNSIWYTNASYVNRDIQAAISLTTPILRGLDLVDESNNAAFLIEDEKDFLYMYELMNRNPLFASNRLTYKIKNDLNLSYFPIENYSYSSFFNANLEGIENANLDTLTDITGGYSKYPTIYGASIMNTVVTEGIECYGIFPWLTGSISKLNFYLNDDITNFSGYDSSISLRAIGLVSGYVEGGSIDEVNVYGNITLPTAGIGKYYIGGICGMMGERGSITNSTTSGSITGGTGVTSHAETSVSGYVGGTAMGGVVGYVTSTSGELATCLSAMNLSTTNYTSSNSNNQAMGGVVGAGYTNTATQLSNKGTITIGTDSNTNYGVIYAAGIIGRHLGLSEQVTSFYNQGDITYYGNTQTAFISGVVNVDIVVSNSSLVVSSLKNTKGRAAYWGSSFTNAANINLSMTSRNENLKLAGVVYVNSINSFVSELSGIYNLAYRKVTNNQTTTTEILNEQSIDMSKVASYAPCLITSATSIDHLSSIQTVYNFKPTTYTTSGTISNDLKYSGCVLGKYINYTDVRNEGDLSFTFSTTAFISNRNLYAVGVFEEVSSGCTAKSIYNGGNISIMDSSTANLGLNVYASGICHANYSEISTSSYNPLNNDFDNTSIGTLNDVINNGDITMTSSGLNTSLAVNDTQKTTFNGNVYTSGIVYSNRGIISNTFNLGDVFIGIYTTSALRMNAAGVSYENNGAYAQIRDSANNGTIKAINLSQVNTYVNASGITCVNNSTNTNHQQVIAFTINYGEIIAFNARSNTYTSANANTYAKAGGILAHGICNIVNTVNYGNVFSTESAGGMIGVIQLSQYSISNSVKIANTLNYGSAKAVNRYVTVQGGTSYATYAEIKDIVTSTSKYVGFGFTSQPYYQYIGALVGIIDYNNQDRINIRYLINFFENVPIVCGEINVPSSVTTDVTKLVNVSPNNTFLGKSVTYAPLSTISESGNIGVFSEDFMLRQAMKGIGLDENEVTDSYIGDFFQFIPFDKINTVILDKIGWRTIAYLDAAERFASDIESLSSLVNKTGLKSTDALVSDAMNSDAWISNCDTTVLKELLTSALADGALTPDLLDIVNYIFFDTTGKSDISNDARSNIIQGILDYIDATESNVNYYNVLNALLYDELLAKVLAQNSVEYSDVLALIRTCVENSDNLETIMDNYIGSLTSNPEILDPLFGTNADYYLESKINLLDTLLTGFNDVELERIFSLLGDASGEDSAKYALYLQNNPAVARNVYISVIGNNSFTNADFRESINNSFAKYNIANVLETESSSTTLNDFTTALNNNTSSPSSAQNITSLNITPSKDYTDIWNTIKNLPAVQTYVQDNILSSVTSVEGTSGKGLYAKATEYTNTYQSNDAPSTPGEKKGKIRANATNTAIETRFIYTPDDVVSYATHYYGPYKTTSNNIWWTNSNPTGYNQGFDLYTTGENASAGVTVRYVPLYVSLDKTDLQNKINGTLNPTVYEFYWNNPRYKNESQGGQSAAQWVSTHILDKVPHDGYNYLVKNYNNSEYIKDYYDFSPGAVHTSTAEGNATNKTIPKGTTISFTRQDENNTPFSFTTTDDVSLNLITKKANSYDIYSGEVRQLYRNEYLKGYCSAALITGIWYQQNIYSSGSQLLGAYLTSKDNQFQDEYQGVHTTQYINYFMDDLLQLDGVLTKGFGNNASSQDERNIISALMQKVLENEEGKTLVMKALAQQANNGLSASDSLSAAVLLETVKSTSFALNAMTNMAYLSSTELENIKYDSTTSLKSYFDSVVVNQEYSTKDLIILRSAANRSNFQQVLLKTYEYSKKAAQSAKYSIPKNDGNSKIYEYVLYLKDENLSDDEITDYISKINVADLEALKNVFIKDKYIPNGTTINGFTFNGEWIYSPIDDGSYSYKLTAGADATISYDNSQSDNSIDNIINYKGTITGNKTSYTNSSIAPQSWVTAPNSNGIYNCDAKTEVYTVEKRELMDTTPLYNKALTGITPTTTNGIETYNILSSNPVGSNKITIVPRNDFDYSSYTDIKLYFSHQMSETSWGGTFRAVVKLDGTTEYTSITSTTLAEYDLSIKEASEVTISSNRNGDGDTRYLIISNLRLVFTKTLSDGTTYTFTQYLNGASNTCIISNPTSKTLDYKIGTGDYQSITVSSASTSISEVGQNEVSFYNREGIDLSNVNYIYQVDTIASNYNSNIKSLSYMDYIIKDKIVEVTNSTTFTTTRTSIVLVKASSDTSSELTIDGVSKTISTLQYYGYQVSAGTYNIATTGITIEEILIIDPEKQVNIETVSNTTSITTTKNDITTSIFNGNYADLASFPINTYIPTALEGMTKYETFLEVYPYHREGDAIELRRNDLIESVITLLPTMKDSNNKYSVFDVSNGVFTEANLKEMAKLVATADYETEDSSLGKLISYIDKNAYRQEIIQLIAANASETTLSDLVIRIQTVINGKTSSSYDAIKTMYIAAYIGSDFLNNLDNNSLQSSKLLTILESYANGIYQFIDSDISINSDTFISLMVHLGFDLSTEGYGIYALSSSKGILNGQFIPDNLGLSTMDACYEDTESGYWKLTNVETSDWRGGDDRTTAALGSVTDGFMNQMKQLKLSISTTIFEMNLVTNGTTIYSSEELIDLSNDTITYYIPSIYKDYSFTISDLNIADGAHKDEAYSDSTFTILGGKIRIVAEDTTVYTDYTVQIEVVDVSYNATLTSAETIPYSNGSLHIKITSPTNEANTHKLPQGLDLSRYITIRSPEGTIMQTSFTFASTPIVDENGSASITMNVETSLPTGEYDVVIALFGIEDNTSTLKQSIHFKKEAGSASELISVEFEGSTYTFKDNQLSNNIPFGRCYNYADLTDQNSSGFYLTNLEVSPGATVSITATKALQQNSDYILVYTITYTVTAESGASNTYTHTLTEVSPYVDGNLAIIYKDGRVDTNAVINANKTITTSFERGNDPTYRVKYNLNNFYSAGTYGYAADSYEGVVVSASYSGISIGLSNDSDAGGYDFNYTYHNTGIWENGMEYDKEFTFPTITIDKLYSTNALLSRLTFLDSATALSSLATVMYPDYPIRPTTNVATNEVSYNVLKNQSVSDTKISVERITIDYKTSASAQNFYTVGSISNAELSNYAPTFAYEENAEIYQYTTLRKLTEYGDGTNPQTKTDEQVINTSNTDTLYLYVPYDDAAGNTYIFMVEVINGKWGKVYPTTYVGDASDTPLATLTANKASFVYENTTYTINAFAGIQSGTNMSNASLFMDYIGTPLSDHFWFVSYVIFSEDYLNKVETSNNNLKFYHIALIDATNTVFFDVSIQAPASFNLQSIYFSIEDRVYSSDGVPTYQRTANISSFAVLNDTTATNKYFTLDRNLQVLPRGYFYFYLALPEGYICKFRIDNDRTNQNANTAEAGAYLPPSSIVTQRIALTIIIEQAATGIIWGQSTSEMFNQSVVEIKS